MSKLRKLLALAILLLPALTFAAQDYVTWGGLVKFLAVTAALQAFLSGLLSLNIVAAVVGALISGVVTYFLASFIANLVK
ncbi:hypothetical protein IPA_06045 [Ignicoccus pacificus DSM 13166]|uniref:Uncharacterized protein n=1 Tax=Ignicoccus pacificus DSM 13166 TaxID=940294 RepID=A0A977KBB6_9CREN|nr:hypothetical protein IPA_06045 [Ignicoccus pacificus DSM 13166]